MHHWKQVFEEGAIFTCLAMPICLFHLRLICSFTLHGVLVCGRCTARLMKIVATGFLYGIIGFGLSLMYSCALGWFVWRGLSRRQKSTLFMTCMLLGAHCINVSNTNDSTFVGIKKKKLVRLRSKL